jgi:hypothetical protein
MLYTEETWRLLTPRTSGSCNSAVLACPHWKSTRRAPAESADRRRPSVDPGSSSVRFCGIASFADTYSSPLRWGLTQRLAAPCPLRSRRAFRCVRRDWRSPRHLAKGRLAAGLSARGPWPADATRSCCVKSASTITERGGWLSPSSAWPTASLARPRRSASVGSPAVHNHLAVRHGSIAVASQPPHSPASRSKIAIDL